MHVFCARLTGRQSYLEQGADMLKGKADVRTYLPLSNLAVPIPASSLSLSVSSTCIRLSFPTLVSIDLAFDSDLTC
jgi:hypothetical protein